MYKQIISIAVFSMGLISLSGCSGGNDKGKAVAPESSAGTQPSTKLVTVSKGSASNERSFPASIRGRQDADIYPQVSGTLRQVLVSEGQVVQKGQTLFVVDPVPFQAALQQASAQVASAESAVATARLSFESSSRLYAEHIISEVAYRTSENSLRSAEAYLAQAKAARANAANSLSYTSVKSPAHGVVGNIPYRQGALVSAGMPQPLTTISDNREVHVYFSIPENNYLELIRSSGNASSALAALPPVRLRLSDGSLYALEGKIESISGVVDRSTGSVTLRACFDNPDHLLHSGASGSIILTDTYQDRIIIPISAIVQQLDKKLVYKVVDGKAVSAFVRGIALSDGKQFLVEEGVSQGDVIVASGAGLLREGMPIQ